MTDLAPATFGGRTATLDQVRAPASGLATRNLAEQMQVLRFLSHGCGAAAKNSTAKIVQIRRRIGGFFLHSLGGGPRNRRRIGDFWQGDSPQHTEGQITHLVEHLHLGSVREALVQPRHQRAAYCLRGLG